MFNTNIMLFKAKKNQIISKPEITQFLGINDNCKISMPVLYLIFTVSITAGYCVIDSLYKSRDFGR